MPGVWVIDSVASKVQVTAAALATKEVHWLRRIKGKGYRQLTSTSTSGQ